jgi:hypothetical protein
MSMNLEDMGSLIPYETAFVQSLDQHSLPGGKHLFEVAIPWFKGKCPAMNFVAKPIPAIRVYSKVDNKERIVRSVPENVSSLGVIGKTEQPEFVGDLHRIAICYIQHAGRVIDARHDAVCHVIAIDPQ